MSNIRRLSLLAVAALAVAAAIAPGAQAAWSSAPFTLPATTSQLVASSCASTTFCVLTGVQTGATARGLTYKYNGTDYTTAAPASNTSELYGVHCQSTTFCMGVGSDYATATPTARAEKFSGTHWTSVTAATPAGSVFTELRGVSCASATHCWAAGRFQTATGDTALVETYGGSSFTQTTVTPPVGTTGAELNGIACSATNACTAVGWYDPPSTVRTPLIFRYNGASWTTQAATVPAGATYSELDGVACPTVAICHAVGFYQDGTGFHSLAQSWNGTSWTNRAVANPTGGQDAALSGVSCWAATTCEAVGNYTDSTNLNSEKLAAAWGGTSWSLQSVPRPMSVSDAQLAGVSCLSLTFCRAAGVSVYDGTTSVTGLRPAIDAGP